MYIKKTCVKSKSGCKTYLQLTQSYYDTGRVRQKVVAGLGRADCLDESLIKSVVEALDSGSTDSLSKEQIALLNPKRYGDMELLSKIFDQIGFSRFFKDLLTLKKAFGYVKQSLLYLLYYMILDDRSEGSMESWLNRFYIEESAPQPDDYRDAAYILSQKNLIRDALRSKPYFNTEADPHVYHFCCETKCQIGRDKVQTEQLGVMTCHNIFPKDVYPFSEFDQYRSKDDFVVLTNRDVLSETIDRLNRDNVLYLVKVAGDGSPDHLEQEILEQANAEHSYTFCNNRACCDINVNGHRVILCTFAAQDCACEGASVVLRSSAAETYVTNSDYSLTEISEIIIKYERVCEHLYEFTLPQEVALTRNEAFALLTNVILIKLSVMQFIEDRLGLNWIAEYVLRLFSEIQATKLVFLEGERLFHTKFSEEQAFVCRKLNVIEAHMQVRIK